MSTILAIYLMVVNLSVAIFSVLTWIKVTNKEALSLTRFRSLRHENASVIKQGLRPLDKDPVDVWEKKIEYTEGLHEQIVNKDNFQRGKLYIENIQGFDRQIQDIDRQIQDIDKLTDKPTEEEIKSLGSIRDRLQSIRDQLQNTFKEEILQIQKHEDLKTARGLLSDLRKKRKSKEKFKKID